MHNDTVSSYYRNFMNILQSHVNHKSHNSGQQGEILSEHNVWVIIIIAVVRKSGVPRHFCSIYAGQSHGGRCPKAIVQLISTNSCCDWLECFNTNNGVKTMKITAETLCSNKILTRLTSRESFIKYIHR